MNRDPFSSMSVLVRSVLGVSTPACDRSENEVDERTRLLFVHLGPSMAGAPRESLNPIRASLTAGSNQTPIIIASRVAETATTWLPA